VQNSLLLANAFTKAGVPFELHIYPDGVHGLSLSTKETWSQNPKTLVPHADSWMPLAIRWVKDFGHFGPETV
jgi:dipeptidyl aminopeptidase/acylaminoacyl peptidase